MHSWTPLCSLWTNNLSWPYFFVDLGFYFPDTLNSDELITVGLICYLTSVFLPFFLTLYIVVGGFSRLLKGLVIPFSSGHHELNSTGIRERLCLTNTKQPNDRHAFAFLATYSFLVCICLSFITILVSYNFMKITLITSMYLHSGSMAQSDLLTTVIFLIIGHSVFLIFASLQHYSAFEMKQLNMT